jgi:hypothetical protein
MDDSDAPVAAVVDYCETQARLLSGQAETLRGEIDDLLNEIDAGASDVRDRLERQETAASSSDGGAISEADIEALEEKQAGVADRQASLDEISALSAGYVDLAAELQDEDLDETAAIQRVLEFEAERDAHTFFDDRTTLLETAAGQ